MKLRIRSAELNRLQTHACEGYPHEVVGILAGSRTEHKVTKVQPLVNERAETHNRYKVSGLLLIRAEQKLEADGLEIVGYYHSHPDHPSQYSKYDQDHALPNMSYLITAVHNGHIHTTQSWRLKEDRSAMVEEIIIEETD